MDPVANPATRLRVVYMFCFCSWFGYLDVWRTKTVVVRGVAKAIFSQMSGFLFLSGSSCYIGRGLDDVRRFRSSAWGEMEKTIMRCLFVFLCYLYGKYV